MTHAWLFDLVPHPSLVVDALHSGELEVGILQAHLEAWADAERLGFHGVFLGEHHYTPYSMTPSPNLLVAALAQRTTALRLGIMCNVVPMHHPLRLAEEGALLDLLSNGRLEFGLGRGADQLEFDTLQIPMEETRARMQEGTDLILRAWTEARFDHRGEHYALDGAAIFPRPLQRPHPRVWITATRTPATIEFAADRGLAIATTFHAASDFREIFDLYHRRRQAAGLSTTSDDVAIARTVHVADSEAQALDEAGEAWDFFVRQFRNTGPVGASASADLYKGWLEPFAGGRQPSLQDLRDEGVVVCGTADQVAEEVVEQCRESGAGNFLAWTWFGNLTATQVRRSHELFAARALPALAALPTPTLPAPTPSDQDRG